MSFFQALPKRERIFYSEKGMPHISPEDAVILEKPVKWSYTEN